MSSYDQAYCKSDVQDGRIVRSRRHVMFTHDITSDKDNAPRSAAPMAFDLSKLGAISGKKY